MDRERRESGQLHTTESLQFTRIDPKLIVRIGKEKSNDWEVVWGAAEFQTDWPVRRAMFESALQASGTNKAIAVRYAMVAAEHRDFALAESGLAMPQASDPANLVPSVAKLWVSQQKKLPPGTIALPRAARFQDYAAEAARARIRLLEAAGYSAYSARRLGYQPEMVALTIVREIAQRPIDESAIPLLSDAARAMQQKPTFLLTELVGQNLERAVLMSRPDAAAAAQVAQRLDQLALRREQLLRLVADVEQDAIEYATESEMIDYFDEMLTLGEEEAMRRLAEKVRSHPSVP